MITFIGLLITVLVITIVGVAAAIIAGGSFIVVFGDVIVFGLIMWLIIKIFRRKKKS